MAAKLALIDPDLLLRLVNNQINPLPPANPTLKEINRIDHNMQSVLSDTLSDPDTQVKKFNELLTKYNIQKENFQKSPTVPSFKSADTNSDQTQSVTKFSRWMEDTIESLPKSVKKTGQLLLNHIKNSGGKLGWDEHGRMMLHGAVIPQTNILDLIHSVVRSRKKAPPPSGVDQFVSALMELNTPTELLRNKPKTTLTPPTPRSRSRRQEDYETPSGYDYSDETPSKTKGKRKTKRRRDIDAESFQTPLNWEKF